MCRTCVLDPPQTLGIKCSCFSHFIQIFALSSFSPKGLSAEVSINTSKQLALENEHRYLNWERLLIVQPQ